MFSRFQQAVSSQFELMKGHQLFRVEVDKHLLWSTYLESFPPGSNPMFRERTEHDCQSCKSFIRAAGSIVAWVDGELVSLWGCEVEEPYATVAKALDELVKGAPIRNVFLHDSQKVGVRRSHQEADDGVVLTWEHFYIELPSACVCKDRGPVYADKKSTRDVFSRSLNEITFDAIEVVLELIEQGSLYRGEEHRYIVQQFAKVWREYDNMLPATEMEKDIFYWRQNLSPAITRVKNSAIGTLLVDLSNGVGLDDAVRLFESKVAPSNYKRPKALVTKAMVERARKTVEDLGYGSALGRRFAVAEDISVGDIIFANRDARRAINADVFDELASEVRNAPKSLEKVEEVPIEVFLESILPKATSVELLFESRHAPNLVNLVAPKDPEVRSLFKWGNNFSWSYAGDLADSIKERVKARGGNVTGDFRASLAWFNFDDLDLHLIEPGGRHIYFGDTCSDETGGELDVDMNVSVEGASRNAVENITYSERGKMYEGVYHLFVHNYTRRERVDVGFEVELEFDGVTTVFSCCREVRPSENVTVAKFEYTHKGGIKILESLPRQSASKVLWGLPTQVFHPVTMVMLSPNHWGDRQIGNKHVFFMLQDCKREGSSRGFFNEYLSDDLREHRKVFELLGAKMRTEEEGDQLSGLGFSSTRRNSVFVRVTGAFTRTINVIL